MKSLSPKKNHLVVVKLFDSGGSNSHFETLIKYLGASNMIVILENDFQVKLLNEKFGNGFKSVKVIPWLTLYIELNFKLTTNVRKIVELLNSWFTMIILAIRFGFATITVSSVEPEKFVYLLTIPFIKVIYILHTWPGPVRTRLTIKQCNSFLGVKKQIVVVSEAMKQSICQNWGITLDRQVYVKVIHNCVADTKLRLSMVPEVKRRVNDIVATIGLVDHVKNPLLWLTAAKVISMKYNGVDFIWIGSGPLLAQCVESCKEFDNINFIGEIEDTNLYLERSSIYYQPSKIETQGIAVLEAMYNKLPCVVSNVGGLPESVIDGYNGYVVSAMDVDEHVSAISTLIENKDLRNQFGENSYARYNELFTYASFKSKMDAIYKCA